MFRVGNQKQLLSGLIFLTLGAFTLWQLPANIGTAATMGPGYFPMLLGICLVLFGGASMLLAVRAHVEVRLEPLPLRTMALVLCGVWLFAALIDGAGLAVSLFCLLALSCAERLRRNLVELLLTYVVLLGLTWFVFIHVIQLPIKFFWWQ